jgi:hypothetical protein
MGEGWGGGNRGGAQGALVQTIDAVQMKLPPNAAYSSYKQTALISSTV